jgi:hypothetical protein
MMADVVPAKDAAAPADAAGAAEAGPTTDAAPVADAASPKDGAPAVDVAPKPDANSSADVAAVDATNDATSDAGVVDCGAGTTPQADYSLGTGTISATIDGVAMKFSKVEVVRTRFGNETFAGGSLTPADPGSISFGVNAKREGTFVCGSNPDGTFASLMYMTSIDDQWTADYAMHSCTLTFTKVATAVCQRWEGSFSGTLVHFRMKPNLTITDGRFSIVRTRL